MSLDTAALGLTELLAEGGEGAIWRTRTPGRLVKLYHHPTPARAAKLEAMIANRPPDPSDNPEQPAIAWPEALVYDAEGRCIGFEMREAKDAHTLPNVYLPALRKAKGLDVDWRYLHAAAYNVAVIMKALHQHGYVIGDLKPQNLLINARAVVTIIDTDSFQVGPHRCPVGTDGFTPPELIGHELTEVDQTATHDHFRLGVLVYLLLFGRHPCQGVWQGDDDPPPLGLGPWCHLPGGPLTPPPGSPDLAVVGSALVSCLQRCFEAPSPADRPEAAAWAKALREALGTLHRCEQGRHYHQPGGPCPCCDGGRDVFAPAAALAKAVPQLLDPGFSVLVPGTDRRSPVLDPEAENTVAGYIAAWFISLGLAAFAPLVYPLDSLPAYYLLLVVGAGAGGLAWRLHADAKKTIRRYVHESQTLPARIASASWDEDSDGDWWVVYDYEFQAPRGYMLTGRHRERVFRRSEEQLLAPGTPLLVAYLDDETFRPY